MRIGDIVAMLIGSVIGCWLFWGVLAPKFADRKDVEEEILLREKWNLENPEFKEICINGKLFILHKGNLTQMFSGGGYKRGVHVVDCVELKDIGKLEAENDELQKQLAKE